jgi:hypothetical protein
MSVVVGKNSSQFTSIQHDWVCNGLRNCVHCVLASFKQVVILRIHVDFGHLIFSKYIHVKAPIVYQIENGVNSTKYEDLLVVDVVLNKIARTCQSTKLPASHLWAGEYDLFLLKVTRIDNKEAIVTYLATVQFIAHAHDASKLKQEQLIVSSGSSKTLSIALKCVFWLTNLLSLPFKLL